jgi:hemerythrin superfamily protein
MNIYQILKKDHKKVENLLNQLVEYSEADKDEWKSCLDQIRDELIPHARAEEALFYNAIRETTSGNNSGSDEVRHGYLEHAMAETDLRTLQAMKAIDVNWTRLAKKLRNDILHHVETEESKLFSEGQKLFTEEEAKMIGRAFEALKPTVKQQSFMGTTLDLVTNLLPRRLVPGFLKSQAKEEKRSA